MPLAYFFATRLTGWTAKVSWVFIYPLPIVLSAYLYRVDPLTPVDLLAVLLAILAVYALYEVGYMDNDTRTTEKETAPTERLSEKERQFFQSRYWVVLVLRLAFVAFMVVAIDWLVEGNDAGKRAFLFGLLVIALLFPVYNSVRGARCLPLHFLLVIARFGAPALVLVDFAYLEYVVVMMLLFPVINLIERSGEARYGLAPMSVFYTQRDLVRVFYYGALAVAAGLAWKMGHINLSVVVLFTWFLVYRTISFLLGKTLRGST